MTAVTLGNAYTDSVSGFKGKATMRTVCLNGCVRVCLVGKAGKDGKIPEEWFDEQQLIGNSSASTGGPSSNARRANDCPTRR